MTAAFDMEDQGMAARANQRRTERALADFKRRLESLDAEEVRALLAERRVRSRERVAMAEARLAELERREPTQPTGAPPRGEHASAGDAGTKARPAVEPNGHDRKDQPASEAEGATNGAAGMEAGQIGRMVGIGLGIASIAALALFVARR
jgi:hypothetical protein